MGEGGGLLGFFGFWVARAAVAAFLVFSVVWGPAGGAAAVKSISGSVGSGLQPAMI